MTASSVNSREGFAPPQAPPRLLEAARAGGAAAGMLTVELFSDDTTFAALGPAWEQLHESVSPHQPFTSPEWNAVWWRTFRRNTPWVKDQLWLFALRDGAGELIGIAPMMLTCRPGRGVFRTKELQFLGADNGVTEMRGPVCRSEDATRVVDAIHAYLGRSHDWHWIQWSGLPRDGVAPSWLSSRIEVGSANCTIDHRVRLQPTWKEFLASRPRNIREAIRKGYNSLSRDGHIFRFCVVSQPDAIEEAVTQFFDLHADRSKLQGTVAHSNVFRAERSRTFLHELHRSLARKQQVRVFQLSIAEEIVATRIGFKTNDELFLYYSGYRTEWGRYSVMTTLLSEIMRWSIDQGTRWVNLSTGVDVSKTRWRPEQVVFEGGFEVREAASARLAFALARFARHHGPLRHALRRMSEDSHSVKPPERCPPDVSVATTRACPPGVP